MKFHYRYRSHLRVQLCLELRAFDLPQHVHLLPRLLELTDDAEVVANHNPSHVSIEEEHDDTNTCVKHLLERFVFDSDPWLSEVLLKHALSSLHNWEDHDVPVSDALAMLVDNASGNQRPLEWRGPLAVR